MHSRRLNTKPKTALWAALPISKHSASGSRSVRFSDSSCTWSQTVTVSESGYYKIKLYSRGEGSNKINNLSVNGSNAGTFSSANGSAYKASTVNGIYLKKGQNTVKITMSWGYFSLDYITIEKMSSSNAYTAAENLVDPYASQSTQRLYSYMKDVYGKKVITGQYCDGGLNGTEFKAIKSATGQTPAMLGLDFMRYTPCRVQNGDTSDAVEKAIEFSRAGGIVTFCWHWNVPDKYLLSGTDGGNPRWWGGFYTKNVDRSKFSLTKIMNGSDPKGYNTLMSDVDEIAKQLKRLSDADVPVLFRPLHEASGGWFWWGADGSEAYKKLWQAIYDKLTNEYKLDNIKAQFITIGGENCLNVSFDLSNSTEMDYIFVRDGKFISFDYQYPFDDAKRQKAAVVKSAKSIRFNQ